MFRVGDTVVYPHHGAGRILEIVEQDFQGTARRYYSIHILHNDMTIMVPVDGTERAGIRPVISEPMVEEVLGVLRDDPTKMPVNWNRRVKHNRDKIKTGDVLEIADVVRNLALRDHEQGPLHRREADVQQGQAHPGLRADVRQEDAPRRRAQLPGRCARRDLRAAPLSRGR